MLRVGLGLLFRVWGVIRASGFGFDSWGFGDDS